MGCLEVALFATRKKPVFRPFRFAYTAGMSLNNRAWPSWAFPCLMLILGFVLGAWSRGAFAPSTRFIVDSNGNVLDGKTGQVCIPLNSAPKQDTPYCLDLYKKY